MGYQNTLHCHKLPPNHPFCPVCVCGTSISSPCNNLLSLVLIIAVTVRDGAVGKSVGFCTSMNRAISRHGKDRPRNFSGENFDNFIREEFSGRILYCIVFLTINILLSNIIKLPTTAVFWSIFAIPSDEEEGEEEGAAMLGQIDQI